MVPRLNFIFAMVLLMCCGFTYTPPGTDTQGQVTKLSFSTASGSLVNLGSAGNAKATVFIFLAPECPISQQCTAAVNKLYNALPGADIHFYGVIPGSLYNREEVSAFATAYHLRFPVLMDTANALATLLNATVTPEVIVIDSACHIVYSGAIDNSYIGLGKRNGGPVTAYLNNAISAVIHGKPLAVKRTVPVGCFIEFKKDKHE